MTKIQNWPFFGKNGQNWPFLAKNARFGLFLPNATINVPHFRHRIIFFGLLKNGANFFWAKILKIDFLGIFYQNLIILGQICSFRPTSPKRYYKCSSFSPWKHIFWSFIKWCNFFFRGEILKFDFLGVF